MIDLEMKRLPYPGYFRGGRRAQVMKGKER
jgi:hypothetical protein